MITDKDRTIHVLKSKIIMFEIHLKHLAEKESPLSKEDLIKEKECFLMMLNKLDADLIELESRTASVNEKI